MPRCQLSRKCSEYGIERVTQVQLEERVMQAIRELTFPHNLRVNRESIVVNSDIS